MPALAMSCDGSEHRYYAAMQLQSGHVCSLQL